MRVTGGDTWSDIDGAWLPLFVERNHVKGRTYLYFRKGKGARFRLADDPRSEEFAAAYRSLLIGMHRLRGRHQRGRTRHDLVVDRIVYEKRGVHEPSTNKKAGYARG